MRDTGVGVPPQKRQEIFQEFVQADSSHARKFGGSGLGLAISKRLVEAMGGDIGIEPAPGNGSIFWFTLPALVVQAAAIARSRFAGKRIAIVTRNKVLREGLALQIEAAGGEAMEFRSLPPGGNIDAILIDAGTDSEPDALYPPRIRCPALVLVTPAARGSLEALQRHGLCRLSGQAGARSLAGAAAGYLHERMRPRPRTAMPELPPRRPEAARARRR